MGGTAHCAPAGFGLQGRFFTFEVVICHSSGHKI